MTNPEAHLRNLMFGLMLQANHPTNATDLAEETALFLGFEEWIDDPEHEIWPVAEEFFNEEGFTHTSNYDNDASIRQLANGWPC